MRIVRLQFLIATTDFDDKEMPKPAGKGPNDEEEVKEVVFQGMTRLRRVERKSNIRVDLASTGGLYTVRLNARTIGNVETGR